MGASLREPVVSRPEAARLALMLWLSGIGGGAGMPQQSQAWARHWRLVPDAVRKSQLTSPRTRGPVARTQKYLFPELFSALPPALYKYGERNTEIERSESDRIKDEIRVQGDNLAFAAECVRLARRAHVDLVGKADGGDLRFEVALQLLKEPRRFGADLNRAVRVAVAHRLGVDTEGQPLEQRPYSPDAFSLAAADDAFVAKLEEVVTTAWEARATDASDLPKVKAVAEFVPLARNGFWDAQRARPGLADDWAGLVANLETIGNVDQNLRRMGLADRYLFDSDGAGAGELLPPRILGGEKAAEAAPLDQSIQTRCSRMNRSTTTRKTTATLGGLDDLTRHVAVAAAAPFGLTTAHARVIVLLAQTIVGELTNAAQAAPRDPCSPDDSWRAPERLARSFSWRVRRRPAPVTERLQERIAYPVLTFIPLVWVRVATEEVIGGLPVSPPDVWKAIMFAWRTWTIDTLNAPKRVRSGEDLEVLAPHSFESSDGRNEWVDFAQLSSSVDPTEQEGPLIGEAAIADLMDHARPEQVHKFILAVAGNERSDDELLEQYGMLCRFVDAATKTNVEWPSYRHVASYIRTHAKRD
ncbi:hypothetical protein SAMN02745244_03014 [Tessaracoccus bendigoensis DSM 12906]|uniref:Uncharacterized protein n=1 Tax=Tessaracoccus bendigoensis DSM 12906 TaxID=1123357 RepID=A0A1M6L898_9ACTN|nr:hypothetical protein [Tessaracoccus bendigoensis]SHJ67422.1 hypothetical protein SAMN02745244_03014 [Tessaracoccus bendigoensis DSM 12906]